jgi:hypothetical protein
LKSEAEYYFEISDFEDPCRIFQNRHPRSHFTSASFNRFRFQVSFPLSEFQSLLEFHFPSARFNRFRSFISLQRVSIAADFQGVPERPNHPSLVALGVARPGCAPARVLAVSIRTGQGVARPAAPARAGKGCTTRAAAPLCAGQGAARAAAKSLADFNDRKLTTGLQAKKQKKNGGERHRK